MNQKEYADYLQDAETAFLALAGRAETLRGNSPYRFHQMDSQSILAWLDKYYIPIELGWKQNEILKLEELLGQKIPDDYKLFLKYLGNLGKQMFGYDDDLRTPIDYLENRNNYLDFGEQWGEASTDPNFNEMMEDGIFLSGLGGFAVWYLARQKSERSMVKFWDEGDGNSVRASIKTEGFLVESMEDRMTRFEWRTDLSERQKQQIKNVWRSIEL
ncbi:SMI1/KNR4 family protein [Deinococcus radiomollis]|uniref:SMI1/KNR4 family protein n=1 Tax=Deinococcus radiomollis TaxID=468916 RepID=UPI0038917843